MHIDFQPARHLYPFESKWFDSDIGRIHYVDEGEGRPLLLLHGNPTWSFLYRDVVRELRDDFRCIAVDYPGFGLSVHPDDYGYTPREHCEVVSSLFEALDLDDTIVMGQDWGGPIGVGTALEHPDRVTGFVFGNTWYWPTDRLLNKLFSRVMSSLVMEWAIVERNFFVERLLPMGTARRLDTDVMRHYRAVQPSPDARRGVFEFPRQLTAARDWLVELRDGVEAEPLTDRPLLLTWGMQDWAFNPGHFLPTWQEAFDDVSTVELEDAAHFIQEDAPDRISRAIRRRFG